MLLDLEDFTYEEIAVLLELPIGTVRSRLHRARKILAKELSQYGKDQGINVRDCNEIAPIDSIDVPLASTD